MSVHFYTILGFIFGLLIPYISRRFEKFMPATAAYAIYRIIKPNKSVSSLKKKNSYKYMKLVKAYRLYSLGWAIASASLSYLAVTRFGNVFSLVFIWILLLLFEIDKRMRLLPDILTIPLLIFGFCYASLLESWVVYVDSAMGAFAGYFIPVLASMFLVWKHKDVFGGGDIKLLAAVGAWLGLEKLLYAIVLSCILFAVYVFINRKREGAFGPAIVVSSMIIAFAFFGI